MGLAKQRVVLDLKIKLKLEMEVHVGGELKTILVGKLNIPEITNDELDDEKLPGECKATCEHNQAWSQFFDRAAKGSWSRLQPTLKELIEQTKQKW